MNRPGSTGQLVAPPQTAGRRYRIKRAVDESGEGTVYEATRPPAGRRVALKIFHEAPSRDTDFHERFTTRARLQSSIDHPNVVEVLESGRSPDGYVLVMEFVDGAESLRGLLDRGRVQDELLFRILKGVASALDGAQAKGLVYRELTPRRILVDRRKGLLGDFGVARPAATPGLLEGDVSDERLHYIAPEEIRGEPTGPRANVYSLAAILYEGLCGLPPYAGAKYWNRTSATGDSRPVLMAHLEDRVPRLSIRRSDLAAQVDDPLRRALSKDPAERQASATEFLHDVERALDPARTASSPKPAAERSAPVVGSPPAVERRQESLPRRLSSRPLRRVRAAVQRRYGAPPRRFSATTLAFAALAMVLAGACGQLLAERLGSQAGRSVPMASSSYAQLPLPAGWRQVDERGTVPGLELAEPVAVAPPGAAGARLVAGRARTEEPSLLPEAFLERLGRGPGRAEAVRLGSVDAYRYRPDPPRGSSNGLVLYAAPTSAGAAVLACSAPPAAIAAFAGECERVAAGVRVRGDTPLALGLSQAYANALKDTLSRLNSARTSARGRLREAKTPAGQQRVASSLAAEYRRAARLLAAASPRGRGARVEAAVVDDLRGAAAGYRAMSGAARRGDAAAWRIGADVVRASEGSLRRGLAILRRRGLASRLP